MCHILVLNSYLDPSFSKFLGPLLEKVLHFSKYNITRPYLFIKSWMSDCLRNGKEVIYSKGTIFTLVSYFVFMNKTMLVNFK